MASERVPTECVPEETDLADPVGRRGDRDREAMLYRCTMGYALVATLSGLGYAMVAADAVAGCLPLAAALTATSL